MKFEEKHFFWLLAAICFCALAISNAGAVIGLLLAILLCMAWGNDDANPSK